MVTVEEMIAIIQREERQLRNAYNKVLASNKNSQLAVSIKEQHVAIVNLMDDLEIENHGYIAATVTGVQGDGNRRSKKPKGILVTLAEVLEREDSKNVKAIKYVDKDGKDINTIKPMLTAPVLFFEVREGGLLFIKLWVENEMPNGWKVITGALTAPVGFEWISNGKSLFDKNYQRALLRC
jgi:hypothetical protein